MDFWMLFSGRRMMMKKVLITLLVLGLASAANADLMFTIGGADAGDTVMPSDVLEVTGVDPVPQGAELYLVGFDGVTITGANLVYGGSISSVMNADDYAAAIGYPDGASLIADLPSFGLPGATDLFAVTLADGNIPQASLAGLMVDGITMGDGEGRLDMVDAGTFAVLDSVNVVVPEPMTIALLGLGGLFLRRRK
jgi:hypothetical protein